jgi:hypothetical protein
VNCGYGHLPLMSATERFISLFIASRNFGPLHNNEVPFLSYFTAQRNTSRPIPSRRSVSIDLDLQDTRWSSARMFDDSTAHFRVKLFP